MVKKVGQHKHCLTSQQSHADYCVQFQGYFLWL